MKKIYVAGPNKEKNSTFIKKFFHDEIMSELLVETQKIEIPKEDFQKMYIILDETVASIMWQRFYFENSKDDKMVLVKKI